MDTRILIAQLARPDGGVFSRRAALRAGVDSADLERLRRRGEISVIRRGWYRIDGTPLVVAAVRAGAVVTCVTALKFHPGVWVPPESTRTHLRRPRHLRAGHTDCRAIRPLPAPVRAVDPLPFALLCAANCLPPEQLVAVLDSTLRMPQPYTRDDLREIFHGGSERVVRLLDFLDELSGSGTESICRYRLQCAHIRVRSQQVIPGVGRVDLLVGERLIIECDSKEHHNDAQRVIDNRRDRAAQRGNYVVLRYEYREIMYDWDAVLAEILQFVRSGRHRGRVEVVNSAEFSGRPGGMSA